MRSVLMCLPHVEEQNHQFRTIDYPFFFITLVEKVGVVKGLIKHGLGVD